MLFSWQLLPIARGARIVDVRKLIRGADEKPTLQPKNLPEGGVTEREIFYTSNK